MGVGGGHKQFQLSIAFWENMFFLWKIYNNNNEVPHLKMGLKYGSAYRTVLSVCNYTVHYEYLI